MFDDILDETEKTDEELFEMISHAEWCALTCLNAMNDLVDAGILTVENTEDGEKPVVLTEKGKNLIKKYWDEYLGREAKKDDLELGMSFLKEEGFLG
jgi:predicted transcriptional regulator